MNNINKSIVLILVVLLCFAVGCSKANDKNQSSDFSSGSSNITDSTNDEAIELPEDEFIKMEENFENTNTSQKDDSSQEDTASKTEEDSPSEESSSDTENEDENNSSNDESEIEQPSQNEDGSIKLPFDKW